MRLKLERANAQGARRTGIEYSAFDEVTGKRVGIVTIDRVYRGHRRYPTRTAARPSR